MNKSKSINPTQLHEKQDALRTFVSVFLGINAQSGRNVEKGLFKLNALVPGASYELGVGKNTTLNFDALLSFGLRGGTDRETEFGIYPGIAADFRYYYNMDRRLGKGKNISGNSGNYIAFTNQFYSGNVGIGNLDVVSNTNYSAAVVYGIQRMRPKGFYWGVSFGPGIFVDDFETLPLLFIDARLGWVISKRK